MSSLSRQRPACPDVRLVSLLFARRSSLLRLFPFSATPSSDIYPLSLHDALPILHPGLRLDRGLRDHPGRLGLQQQVLSARGPARSEEHTSELQSRVDLVCRLLLEKKKKKQKMTKSHLTGTQNAKRTQE